MGLTHIECSKAASLRTLAANIKCYYMSDEKIQENLHFKKECVLNFEKGASLDFPVYRVYTIDRLVQLFNQQKNTLVKPLMWDDPFENLVFQQTAKTKSGQQVQFSNIRECLYG